MFSLTWKKMGEIWRRLVARTQMTRTGLCRRGGTRPEVYIKSQALYTKVSQLIDLYLIKTLTHFTPDSS